MSRPFQLTSCFTLGRGHHTVRHKGSPVESKATGSVGQFSHFMPQQQGRCSGLQNYLVYCMSFVSNCVNWVYLDSHIFTTGFAVTSQQMEIVCPRHGFYLTVLRGFCGALYSQPDLTPFTLDKHNTKEKLKFYVRGRVITCRKKDSNSAGSPTTHKSSSNESFLSKQGFKTNCTRSPSAPPLAHPSLSSPFSW